MLTGRFDRNTTFDKTDFRSSIPRTYCHRLAPGTEAVDCPYSRHETY